MAAIKMNHRNVSECFKKDEAHDLLIANRFLDDESIWYLLTYADQEAWDHIYENRRNYAHRIQVLIEPYDFLPDRAKIKMRHREMTDEDMVNAEKEYRVSRMKQFEPIWETMKDSIPDRPVDELDDEFDDAWNALSAARDKMTIYMEKKRGAYVAPSARNVVPIEQQELEKDYNECKKNFDKLEKLIEKADTEYLEKKKNERFEIWMREV